MVEESMSLNLNRIKSIDIFRGICMSQMILGHLFDWWLKAEQSWIRNIMTMIFIPYDSNPKK